MHDTWQGNWICNCVQAESLNQIISIYFTILLSLIINLLVCLQVYAHIKFHLKFAFIKNKTKKDIGNFEKKEKNYKLDFIRIKNYCFQKRSLK